MVYDFYFRAALFGFLMVLALLSAKNYFGHAEVSPRNVGLTFMALTCLTFGIRCLYLRGVETDVDTSTWLSAVISFNHYPDKLWTLLTFTDSRPLTVFPLIVGTSLGLPVNYHGAEIVGIILWLTTAYLLYRMLLLIADAYTSLFITGSLYLVLATISHMLAAYNSEHFSIVMLAGVVAGYFAYLYGKWDQGVVAVLMGFLLGSLVYAKFQNAPMGIVTGLFLVFEMIQKRDWRNMVLLLVTTILPTVLINVYFFHRNSLDDFWNAYFWNYFYYSYTTQFSSMPVAERFSPGRVLSFLFYSYQSGIYLFTLTCIVAIGLVLQARKISGLASRQKQLLIFLLVLMVSSVYAVLQSGNNFEHYKLYLFLPLLLSGGMLINMSTISMRKYLVTFLLFGTLAQTAVNILKLEKVASIKDNEILDQMVVSCIQKYTAGSEPVVVWGWRDRLHVLSGRAMGYRNVHPFHFSMKSPLLSHWNGDFLEDMEKYKPKLYIEAMLPNYSERGDLYLPHDKVPIVREYVQKHYILLERLGGVTVFQRKELD